MIKGEKLFTEKGIQVMLFPLEYLNMSQDEGGDFSHAGTLSMDFLGWGKDGRILKCPYYAPVDARCIAKTEEANRIYESLTPVLFADGTIDYVTWVQAHDDFPKPIGTIVRQGDLLGHTGTLGNVTGDHLHLNIAKGKYKNWEQVPPNNNWQLKNSIHIYDACFVNDTVIINGFNHDWKIYIRPVPTFTKPKKNFPWVLYANKLRNRNF